MLFVKVRSDLFRSQEANGTQMEEVDIILIPIGLWKNWSGTGSRDNSQRRL